jgi:hypothetical protein
MPFDIDPVSVWAAAHGALVDAGDPTRARMITEKAERWLAGTTKSGVPAEARASFARLHAVACRAMRMALPPLQ